MASMDDIYDILGKLEKENIDYLFITIQHGKTNKPPPQERNAMWRLATAAS